MDFNTAVKQARAELQATDADALKIAMKYAEQVDDDFNDTCDAIYCEITDMFVVVNRNIYYLL
jgi:hypothetical protein